MLKTAGLVTFFEEILNWKIQFLWSAMNLETHGILHDNVSNFGVICSSGSINKTRILEQQSLKPVIFNFLLVINVLYCSLSDNLSQKVKTWNPSALRSISNMKHALNICFMKLRIARPLKPCSLYPLTLIFKL